MQLYAAYQRVDAGNRAMFGRGPPLGRRAVLGAPSAIVPRNLDQVDASDAPAERTARDLDLQFAAVTAAIVLRATCHDGHPLLR
jgi:hypothetical protein